jgi:cell division protein ZapE
MQDSKPGTLLSLAPSVSDDELLSQLVPPREFLKATFANYIPDKNFDSQRAAVEVAELFATKPDKFYKKFKVNHMYLDGGFGVGKTHLLASIFHGAKGKKAFGSFLAFTGLIGTLGFASCMQKLSTYDLICIDEFELDDPGDTMLLSRMLSELDARGVRFAATSNTPPNALGKGRFAAEDFAREISAMAHRFFMLSIEGEDYRHRPIGGHSRSLSQAELSEWVGSQLELGGRVFVNKFDETLVFLASMHPTKYSAVIASMDSFAIQEVHQLHDQVAALRWVAFVDRLYESQIRVRNTGTPLTDVFSSELVIGTYRKKYLRAVSRLGSLTEI